MRIIVVGEAMLELSRAGGGDLWRLGYGGDTLNTSLHLARFGLDVSYVTALGADPFSAEVRVAWAGEGLDTGMILTDPDRHTGLYAINVDAAGERSFVYWRDNSAARRLFSLPGFAALESRIAEADLLFYSLITLAILPPAGRAQLFALCRQVRARGGRVAFDGNYRPRLWASPEAARAARDQALTCCDIGLPTLEDEQLLGDVTDVEQVAAHWRGAGVAEVVVKLGRAGCLGADGAIVPPPCALDLVDSSGAGDAFNAGYLRARLAGESCTAAALAGHRLAGWVVSHPGAIPPCNSGFDYAPCREFGAPAQHSGGSGVQGQRLSP